jgi:hypothetical protein
VFPMRHHPRVIPRQQAAAHGDAQQPPPHAPLHVGEGSLIKPGGGLGGEVGVSAESLARLAQHWPGWGEWEGKR